MKNDSGKQNEEKRGLLDNIKEAATTLKERFTKASNQLADNFRKETNKRVETAGVIMEDLTAVTKEKLSEKGTELKETLSGKKEWDKKSKHSPQNTVELNDLSVPEPTGHSKGKKAAQILGESQTVIQSSKNPKAAQILGAPEAGIKESLEKDSNVALSEGGVGTPPATPSPAPVSRGRAGMKGGRQ